jgi:hypothetical protein
MISVFRLLSALGSIQSTRRRALNISLLGAQSPYGLSLRAQQSKLPVIGSLSANKLEGQEKPFFTNGWNEEKVFIDLHGIGAVFSVFDMPTNYRSASGS